MRRAAAHAATLLVAAGCATGAGTGPAGADGRTAPGDGEWVRRVHGFPVRDSAGAAYPFPFLGGFDVPRPQLLDIDGDGDDDLFLQERSGEVMFFERVAPTGEDAPPFEWRTDDYRDLAVGEWFRFGDVDMDGDPDLLAEEPFSLVRYYRNEGESRSAGEPGRPEFVLAADTLRTVEGEAIFSDRQNIPNVGNVDCDGLQDLLVGRLDGTIARFEVARDAATPPEEDRGGAGEAAPRFRLVTDRFQDIEIVTGVVQVPGERPARPGGSGGPGGIRHGANSLVATDFDGDGDVDLFWGDYFEPGLLYIENTGSCAHPDLRGEPVPFPPGDPLKTSGYNAPTFGDLDGDGDRDLLVGVIGGAYDPTTTAAENLYYLENREEGWQLRARRYLSGVDVGSESRPSFVDLDRDGDLDLLIANKIDPEERATSVIRRFENVGTPARPEWRRAGSLAMRGAYQYAPSFGDLDGDGDPDLALGDWQDRVAFWRNEAPGAASGESRDDGSGGGWPSFTLADSALVELSRGSHAVPALGDVDADGDLDLFVGEASGTLNFFRNVGTPEEPAFEAVSDSFGGWDVGRRSAPELVDFDGDGDLDLLVGSEDAGILLFRNRGTPAAPRFVEEGRLDAATRGLSAPALADVDADGRLELFSGSASGGLLFFRRP